MPLMPKLPAVPSLPDLPAALVQFARDVRSNLEGVLAIPLLNGHLLAAETITTSSTKINHRLSRPLRGWIVVRKNADARVWEPSTPDDRYLFLQASATVKVVLWVF